MGAMPIRADIVPGFSAAAGLMRQIRGIDGADAPAGSFQKIEKRSYAIPDKNNFLYGDQADIS